MAILVATGWGLQVVQRNNLNVILFARPTPVPAAAIPQHVSAGENQVFCCCAMTESHKIRIDAHHKVPS